MFRGIFMFLDIYLQLTMNISDCRTLLFQFIFRASSLHHHHSTLFLPWPSLLHSSTYSLIAIKLLFRSEMCYAANLICLHLNSHQKRPHIEGNRALPRLLRYAVVPQTPKAEESSVSRQNKKRTKFVHFQTSFLMHESNIFVSGELVNKSH